MHPARNIELQETQLESSINHLAQAPVAVKGNGSAHVRAGSSVAVPVVHPTSSGDTPNLRNSTVLPLVEGAGEAATLRPRLETRYQRVRTLGSGAMGEVDLAVDNDIGRTVAVKKLHSRTQSTAGIARFIEEIRTIGRLEHPNIVPIHDVGIDEQGQIFFVMKHIDGETLESVISKLEAGNPEYLERYTIDVRIEIFLGILRALQCAHAKGIIHRGP